MKRLLWIMLVVAGFAPASWAAEVDYEGRLLDQVEMAAVTEAQYDAFREVLRGYHEARNGAVRRVSRQGGDIPTRVRRDLRRLARRTVKELGEVLMPEQLPHIEKYLELANEQYMVQAGLLQHVPVSPTPIKDVNRAFAMALDTPTGSVNVQMSP